MKTYIIGVVAVIALTGAACGTPKQTSNSTTNSVTNTTVNSNTTSAKPVTWMQTGTGWIADGTVPACPTPLIQSPVPLDQVTSILYPGQYRTEYKPHGGFRFDQATSNNVNIVAPADAQVVRGARYIVKGETQYTFDFIMPCGMMYRLGHLRVLSDKYQAIADAFPQNAEGDSRTTNVSPTVSATAGELIATATGLINDKNVFLDFGVYNLREKNRIAQSDPNFIPTHPGELPPYGICWFDSLPATDAARVKSLPSADGKSGKTSDYCSS